MLIDDNRWYNIRSTKLMQPLTLANLLPMLAAGIERLRPWQINDPTRADHGAIYQAEWGVAEPRLTGKFIVSCGYLALAGALPDAQLLVQANLAADYLLRARRPSGLIDLISVNIDSSPDTGFAVQELCSVLTLARDLPVTDPNWAALIAKITEFVRGAVPGLLTGGFHTPNHRWVMVSALVQARALFPDLDATGDVRAVVEAYLAETIDLDEEGLFIERSIGVYDAVNDRSLLLIHEYWDCPTALGAVERNLTSDLQLLHADGTAETGLSRRQDYGTRQVALGLVPYLLWTHKLRPNPVYAQAAQALWQAYLRRTNTQINDHAAHLDWLTYVLLRYGDAEAAEPLLPSNYTRHLPLNGIHRVRRDERNASFFRDTTRLLTITHGEAELSSLKISQTYFGQYIGRFVAETMTLHDETLVLRSEGRANPRRPAYEMPLGRPVPPDQWTTTMGERDLRWLPHAVGDLTVTETADGFALRYQTVQGTDNVAAQIALDFPPGGIWESADTRTQTVAGQVIFLKEGWGSMRYGVDVIQFGPGHLTHGMWQMRDAESAPDHTRVLLTFFTPVDFTLQIRTLRGPLTEPMGY